MFQSSRTDTGVSVSSEHHDWKPNSDANLTSRINITRSIPLHLHLHVNHAYSEPINEFNTPWNRIIGSIPSISVIVVIVDCNNTREISKLTYYML